MVSWGRADYVALYTGICSMAYMAMLGFGLYILLGVIQKSNNTKINMEVKKLLDSSDFQR